MNVDIQQVKQRFGIIGNSTAMLHAIERALQVAPTDLSVLVTGDSGVGKEFFPQILHQYSHRKHGRYIAVNCGAIPEGTIDSELFGHEKGSFTGALSDRKGYFEEADGGTIFLDEVGELPLTTQARLLRVLETGEFIKVGSSKVLKTNVRIVAATNLDMSKAVCENRFREDLFYRLNTIPIQVPPLRERTQDIWLIFRKFANDFAEKYRMPAIQLSEDAKELLLSYRFPGNVRQLKNITEQISIIETSRDISAVTLQRYLPQVHAEKLPMVNIDGKEGGILGSERELLYQVIYEMRKEIAELRQLVHSVVDVPATNLPTSYLPQASDKSISTGLSVLHPMKTYHTESHEAHIERDAEVEDHEYIEEVSTLEDAEREMILKTLEKNDGKRKKTAEELRISERTLYRKIKEYNLDN